MRGIVILILFFCIGGSYAQNKLSSEQYINLYKDYAIYEMYTSGVPASITLAQGILESQNGNSRLAVEANNHFGIKCKTGWTGKSIVSDDDEIGECFRAYESVAESYRDHSNFLKENWRYSECFKLEKTDYEKWADGLKKAGYATNPKYNTLLIGLIERYQLHQFDLAPIPEGLNKEQIVVKQDNQAIYAQEGENINLYPPQKEVKLERIYQSDDSKNSKNIQPDDLKNLKPIRRKGSTPSNMVVESEKFTEITQLFGFKLKHLYAKKDEELTGNPKKKKTVSDAASKENPNTDKDYLSKNKPVEPKSPEVYKFSKNELTREEIEKNIKNGYHLIQSGDNLYRISETYRIFVEDLLMWNGIFSADQLHPGDKIFLSKESASKNRTSSKGGKFHEVEKGETAYKICRDHGISINDLKSWNHLKDLNQLYVGQRLIVQK
ncbi:MAG: glucosaminidase domain-containing protein [Flavobacteriales bacterium]|nr:glucosaminidase domain-containing protein [Flavobacteriales bacterium]